MEQPQLPNRYIKALEARYQAKIDEGIAIIDLYMSKSAGFGEHTDLISV